MYVKVLITAFVVAIIALLVFTYVVPPGKNLKETPAFLIRNRTEYIDLDNGVRLHFLKKGSGSPVILVHGGGTWLYSYRHTIDALAEKHTVYALDMPGHGYTTYTNPDMLNLQGFSDLINTFMERKGLDTADFVGNSWGGGWILHFAQTHPEKTNKLVLIDSTGTTEIASHDGSSWKYLSYPLAGELLVHFFSYGNVAHDIRTNLLYDQTRVTDAEIRDTYIPLTFSHNLRAQYILQRNLHWDEVESKLGSLKNPTLVIWGENDRYIPVNYGRNLAGKIQDVHFEQISHAGHIPHEEKPNEVNDLLRSFLQ